MLKNTALVTIFIALSSILGFVAQIVYASVFGASNEMDVYFKLLSIPAIVTGIAPVIFSSILIPYLASLKGDQFRQSKSIESIWLIVLAFSFVFVFVGLLFSFIIIDSFKLIDQSDFKNTAIFMSCLLWVGSSFLLISGFLIAVLNYRQEFFKISWVSILPSSLMILSVLFLNSLIGIKSLAIGYFLSHALQLVILLFYTGLRIPKEIRFRFSCDSKILANSFYVTLSLLPFTVFVPIAYSLASELDAGMISYLGYSQSFSGFLSVAVSMGISMVAFPNLADLVASGDTKSALLSINKSLRYVIVFALFISGILISLRKPILEIFYKRGEFTSTSVDALSDVLIWYLISGVFIGSLNILRILFYAFQRYKVIALFGIFSTVVFYFITSELITQFSYIGVGIANTSTFGILLFLLLYYGRYLNFTFLNINFFKFLGINSLTLIFSIYSTQYIFHFISEYLPKIASVFISGILFSIVFITITHFVFRLEEMREIIRVIKLRVSQN